MSVDSALETLLITRDDIAAIVAAVGTDQLMDEVIAGLGAAFRGFDLRDKVPVRDGFVIRSRRKGTLEWFALEDRVAVDVMLQHARALGCGTLLPIENLTEDPQDPYSRPLKRARTAARPRPARLPGAVGERSS